ncbi:jg6196 [Pararge aegeria aegeria]|uniref:Jg6196 protein n=1 Tax=Pararge aegeria aegeria TaxID=348720 RepID=A0A8S4S395_9NEOP|nr:jg6196 [Pararge aegeria aegeria]
MVNVLKQVKVKYVCVTDSPLCRACMEENETLTHVMLECTGVTEHVQQAKRLRAETAQREEEEEELNPAASSIISGYKQVDYNFHVNIAYTSATKKIKKFKSFINNFQLYSFVKFGQTVVKTKTVII